MIALCSDIRELGVDEIDEICGARSRPFREIGQWIIGGIVGGAAWDGAKAIARSVNEHNDLGESYLINNKFKYMP